MDDEFAIRQRAYAALDATKDVAEKSAARRLARLHIRESPSPLPETPPAPDVAVAPSTGLAEWLAYVEATVDQRLAPLADGIGKAIAVLKAQMRAELHAEMRMAVDNLRKELAPDVELNKRLAALGAGLNRIETMLTMPERRDGILPN